MGWGRDGERGRSAWVGGAWTREEEKSGSGIAREGCGWLAVDQDAAADNSSGWRGTVFNGPNNNSAVKFTVQSRPSLGCGDSLCNPRSRIRCLSAWWLLLLLLLSLSGKEGSCVAQGGGTRDAGVRLEAVDSMYKRGVCGCRCRTLSSLCAADCAAESGKLCSVCAALSALSALSALRAPCRCASTLLDIPRSPVGLQLPSSTTLDSPQPFSPPPAPIISSVRRHPALLHFPKLASSRELQQKNSLSTVSAPLLMRPARLCAHHPSVTASLAATSARATLPF